MSDTAGLCGGTEHVLLPLSKHAAGTLMHLARLSDGSRMQISPFCHEQPAGPNEVQEIRGWTLDTPAEATASSLPMGPAMFDGISIVQCQMTEPEILDILRGASLFRTRLGEIIKRIRHRTELNPGQRATWARCQPASTGYPGSLLDACRNRTGSVVFAPAPSSVPILDSDTWIPELSDNGFVGVFHHWFHGAQDHRLCLYVACRSYLPAACLEFADLVHDMGSRCTAATVFLSEEAHWLRRANTRNRCRILADVCRELNLNVQTTQDHNAQVPKEFVVAVPDVETLHNDMYLVDTDHAIRISNALSETSRASNGIGCMLAPWEGLVVFHGVAGGQVAGDFGVAHGRQFLPTSLPRTSGVPTLESSVSAQSFAFTTGDPVYSRPLQVWGPVSSKVALYTQPELRTDIVEAHLTEAHSALDPDIIAAYKKLVGRGSCGNVVLMPNIPGIVSSSGASYTFLRFDEAVLCAMASNGWDRARGYTILVPFATALASMCPCANRDTSDE